VIHITHWLVRVVNHLFSPRRISSIASLDCTPATGAVVCSLGEGRCSATNTSSAASGVRPMPTTLDVDRGEPPS
jgi:hypothetical protein